MTIHVGELDPEKPHLGYDYGGCSIESGLEREKCPHCGSPDCCYDCDMSVAEMRDGKSKLQGDPEHEVAGRLMFNGAMDGIESLVLACACAGIDVESNAFVEAVETSVQGAANNL